MEQDFHGNFRVNVTCLFALISPASLTESCSFWYGLKDLFTLNKLAKFVLDRYDDVKSSRRDVDLHG